LLLQARRTTRAFKGHLTTIALSEKTMGKSGRRQRIAPSFAQGSEVNEPAYHPTRDRTTRQPLLLNIVDFIMQIPLLNTICMVFLLCVCTLCDCILQHWRTEEGALSEFLSLPVSEGRVNHPPFHLHVYIRRSLVQEDRAFIMGIDVASRFIVFSIPTETDVIASILIPQIIKELCQSTIRLNQDFPGKVGRPSFISTSDYLIYTELCQKLSHHGTLVRKDVESKMMIGTIPLTSITDALATTIDRNSLSLLQGQQEVLPPVKETYRSSRTKPGVNRSTVKKEYSVPPSLEFCACCGTLQLSKMLRSCGECQVVHYCSKTCQKKDWKAHKELCKLLKGKHFL
jgi:hypothetical protein